MRRLFSVPILWRDSRSRPELLLGLQFPWKPSIQTDSPQTFPDTYQAFLPLHYAQTWPGADCWMPAPAGLPSPHPPSRSGKHDSHCALFRQIPFCVIFCSRRSADVSVAVPRTREGSAASGQSQHPQELRQNSAAFRTQPGTSQRRGQIRFPRQRLRLLSHSIRGRTRSPPEWRL